MEKHKAEIVKKCMELSGLNQAQLANEIDCSQQLISNWMRYDNRSPSVISCIKLSKSCNWEIDAMDIFKPEDRIVMQEYQSRSNLK